MQKTLSSLFIRTLAQPAFTLAFTAVALTGCFDDAPSQQPPVPLEQRNASLENIGYGTMRSTRYSPSAMGDRPLLTIRVTAPDATPPPGAPIVHRSREAIAQELFLGDWSAAYYFDATSNGAFTFTNAGITDVLEIAPTRGPEETIVSAVIAAGNAGFAFRNYDTNQDGTVDPSELTIQAIDDFSRTGGATRYYCPRVDGVNVCGMGAIIGADVYDSTIVHELAHTLGAHDWYGSGCLGFNVTLMSCSGYGTVPFLDPWHKMRLGWVEPQLVPLSGHLYESDLIPFDIDSERYYPPSEMNDTKFTASAAAALRAPPLSNEVPLTPAPLGQYGCQKIRQASDPRSKPLALFSSSKGTREYFLVEARSDAPLQNLDPARPGVYVWQIRTDDYNNTFSISALDDAAKIDPTGFLFGPQGIRGEITPHTHAEGPFELRWIDGKNTGIIFTVGSPQLEPDGFNSYWVSWMSSGTTPPVLVDQVSIEEESIVIRGILPLQKVGTDLNEGFRLKSGNVFLPITVEYTSCNEARITNNIGWPTEFIQQLALYWGETELCSDLRCL